MADPAPGAQIIDGKAIAKAIHEEIAQEVAQLKEQHGKVPGLAVVIVGERKDSQTYVRMKRKACAEVGINSINVDLPEKTSQAELLDQVLELNVDPDVHGILVQLPLPKHINEEAILNAVGLDKDVDGFHPLNIGKLCMKGREPSSIPCTPKGCIELLKRSKIPIEKKKAVVVGRSNIVGMPAALLLMKNNATVTVVHSRTPDPQDIVKEADIVIAAAGQPQMIKKDWIKPLSTLGQMPWTKLGSRRCWAHDHSNAASKHCQLCKGSLCKQCLMITDEQGTGLIS